MTRAGPPWASSHHASLDSACLSSANPLPAFLVSPLASAISRRPLPSPDRRNRSSRSRSSRSSSPAPGAKAAAAASRLRSGVSDDIPVAKRTTPAQPARTSLIGRFGSIGLAAMLAATAVVVAFPGPLRRWLTPPPVQGLQARLSADGRLLGHFPYAEAPAAQLLQIAPGISLQRDAAGALLAMQRAAAAEGISLRVLSGFRSIDLQKRLFFEVKSERNQSARDRARVSAPPGFSEHSTGYAVDLGDGRAPQTDLSPSFAQTAAFRWLQAHAARHHFTLSFPPGNAQGVSYEPWHWRWEGSAAALHVFEPAQRLSR